MSCKTGFNSFQLKLIALILMTFDHIHYFGSTITVMPAWLHVLAAFLRRCFCLFWHRECITPATDSNICCGSIWLHYSWPWATA